MSTSNGATEVTIIGRSSSHFTRVTRIFAVELGMAHAFEVVRDLRSLQPDDYAGNPALKIPSLKTPHGVWFGAQNICRELERRSSRSLRIVWPEDSTDPLLANAQELVASAMTTEVALIMGGLVADDRGGTPDKLMASLTNVLDWLDRKLAAVLAELPQARALSYFEVTLFCLVTHLEFRSVAPTAAYAQLNGFCREFARRASAAGTPYRFDD